MTLHHTAKSKLVKPRKTLFFGTILLVIFLGGCVPTISERYNGPEVSGRIVRLSDLMPVANAKISYGDTQSPSEDNNVALSNKAGYFVLQPNTYLKPEILMPANMAKTTTIHVYSSLSMQANYVVSGFQDGFYTQMDIGSLIVDDNSDEWSTPFSSGGIDLAVLRGGGAFDGMFSGCDKENGYSAMQLLNISRKLTQVKTTGSLISLESKRSYLKESLGQTQLMWEHFIYQCNDQKPNQHLRDLYLQVVQELESMKVTID
ncbi:hypothetical protein [Marinomonas foliarum]|uniref:Lipoprotein n=1 Tax=Marinomonas foliarum TaxID=491950 RepID=A0ABX7IPV5_9GAMM|nr:hypothetical protein [Marinomonas foliarum]QRV24358.1 hypothetical protein JSY38_02125 [Marinomonas foliarum]